MSLFLTNAELQELTGYKIVSKQLHWLRCRGYYVESNARGVPRITYTQIEEMRRINAPAMSHIQHVTPNNTNQHLPTKSEPNINGLRQIIQKRAA